MVGSREMSACENETEAGASYTAAAKAVGLADTSTVGSRLTLATLVGPDAARSFAAAVALAAFAVRLADAALLDGTPVKVVKWPETVAVMAVMVSVAVACSWHMRLGSELVTDLGIELDNGGDIKLGAFQETSVRGIFAAGDCASTQKYVAIASAMGTMAGAGAAQQLQAEKTYSA